MSSDMTGRIDAVLQGAVDAGLPGVVALATDREGTIYQGAAGVRCLGEDQAMTPDTVMAIFSTTKAITGTVALCLMEDGCLDLDAPAREYVPALGEIEVLEGFDEAGVPVTRPPVRDITVRHLLLHTAGFGYELFNPIYRQLSDSGHIGNVLSSQLSSLKSPLLFDPGERWEYGCGLDWTGQVIEALTGRRLGEVMEERVFAPLGMCSTAFSLTSGMRGRKASMHQRDPDGLIAAIDFELPPDPEIHMGGHGLYGTMTDYIRFIRMWLNDGDGPGGRVLSVPTVDMAVRGGTEGLEIGPLSNARPTVTNVADLLPGIDTSWGLSFLINGVATRTGRAAGSLAWAGLGNLYYWIDRATGVGGIWATQLFPFADAASLSSFAEFEAQVYRQVGN